MKYICILYFAHSTGWIFRSEPKGPYATNLSRQEAQAVSVHAAIRLRPSWQIRIRYGGFSFVRIELCRATHFMGSKGTYVSGGKCSLTSLSFLASYSGSVIWGLSFQRSFSVAVMNVSKGTYGLYGRHVEDA